MTTQLEQDVALAKEHISRWHNLYEEDIHAFANAIRKQAVPQWINVENRLPEFLPDQDYSANVMGFDGKEIGIYHRYFEGDGWMWAKATDTWRGLKDCDCYADDDYKVTHWMPLPAAPTREEG